MFVRFRKSKNRLQVSLVATKRVDGKVRHEHVASLASVPMPASVHDRLDFWRRLHERLARLGNRLDAAKQGKIMGEVHARIPMAMLDEQHALKVKDAEADERFWQVLHDIQKDSLAGHRRLIASAQKAIAEGEAAMTQSAQKTEAAKERIAKLRRGEDVPGGLGRPMTQKQWLAAIGWTDKDLRNSRVLQDLYKIGAWDEAIRAARDSHKKSERAAFRAVLRKRLRELGDD